MPSWGDVEVYNQMIDDLAKFRTQVNAGCAVIATGVNTCLETMQQDAASLKAARQVNESVKTYAKAMEMAEKLEKDLAEERDDIIEYLRRLEELNNQ